MKETMKLVTVLLLITAAAALVLGITNELTYPIIEKNAAIKYQEALKAVYPGADSFEKEEQDFSDNPNIAEVQKAMKGGEVVGYVIKAIGTGGYGGNIEFVIGIDKENKIVGFNVLSAAETPGFGAKIKDDDYKADLIGKTSAVEIDGITGATITSGAMQRGYEAVFSTIGILNGTEEKVDINVVREEKILSVFEGATLTDKSTDVASENILYAAVVKKNGEVIGSVFHVETPEGFGGTVEFLLMLNREGKVVGFEVLNHAESEGYGAEITSENYKKSVMNKVSAEKIEAISGATVTSKAMEAGFEAAFEAASKLK